MKLRRILGSAGLASAASLTLVACGEGASNNNVDIGKIASKFLESMPKKQAKQGGTLKAALRSESPFTGIFSDELQTISTDAEEALFDTDDNFKINDKGPATMKTD